MTHCTVHRLDVEHRFGPATPEGRALRRWAARQPEGDHYREIEDYVPISQWARPHPVAAYVCHQIAPTVAQALGRPVWPILAGALAIPAGVRLLPHVDARAHVDAHVTYMAHLDADEWPLQIAREPYAGLRPTSSTTGETLAAAHAAMAAWRGEVDTYSTRQGEVILFDGRHHIHSRPPLPHGRCVQLILRYTSDAARRHDMIGGDWSGYAGAGQAALASLAVPVEVIRDALGAEDIRRLRGIERTSQGPGAMFVHGEAVIDPTVRDVEVRQLDEADASWLFARLDAIARTLAPSIVGAEDVTRRGARRPGHTPGTPPRTADTAQHYTYRAGQHIGWHDDDGHESVAWREMTLSLCIDAAEAGGALEVAGFGAVTLRPGDAVAYPASARHRVTPITAGVRRSIVVWYARQ